jgi:hypothetical protein
MVTATTPGSLGFLLSPAILNRSEQVAREPYSFSHELAEIHEAPGCQHAY